MRTKFLPIVLSSIMVLFTGLAVPVFGQGVTTAAINGVVTDQDGQGLEGATVVALHEPTGTRYGVISREGGQYNLPNVRVGGPYTITTSFSGYEENKVQGIYLNLGQRQRVNFLLNESLEGGATTEEVLITAEITAMGGKKTGSETVIGLDQINVLPTVSRDITDFTRLTPQATLTEGSNGELGFSVAGQNNRFNSVFFDGAISNDVFGLTSQGTNGGQAGVSPISMDAIEQFNVVVAPYDVTIGGFAGAAVNAVTRSGSNKVDASAYFLYRNQGLAGKTPTDDPDFERVPLADFSTYTTGLRVGGPLIKDKLFFFVSGEIENRNTPQPFDFDTYRGDASMEELNGLSSYLQNTYGYDPGTYLDNPFTVKAEKLLVKLDWNINDNNKLTVRHSYSNGRAEKKGPSNNSNINFSNIYEYFPTITNSFAAELNSMFGDKYANKVILGITSIRDDRDPLGNPFPRVRIADGSGTINFGSEEFSTANNLEQDIITLTDNFNIYSGAHKITLGTHNEFYKVFNLFVRQNYGAYNYGSLQDFYDDANPTQYARSYSLNPDGSIENAAGDDIVNAAASFNAMQLGFYAQDEWDVSSKFALTVGLRVDIPMWLDQPLGDDLFNEQALPKIEQYWDLEGARSGQMPKTQIMFAPRVGFNWDVTGEGTTIVRGGVGLFTSRLPLVWAGGSFTNNGNSIGGVFETDPDITFRSDVNNQYTALDFGGVDATPSGQIDLFSENTKYPQVLRASAAIDQKLPWGMVATLEGIFSKTMNSIYYRNVNLKPATQNLEGVDDREYFNFRDEIVDWIVKGGDSLRAPYTQIIWGGNTSEGYTVNLTASLRKKIEKGFGFGVAYNFGYAEAVNDLTSSQNSSQWRDVEVGPYGKNNLVSTRSDFAAGHRVIIDASYKRDFTDWLAATLSVFYNGQSGEVFSYTYDGLVPASGGDNLTNQDTRDYTDLMFVPASQSDIIFGKWDATARAAVPGSEADQAAQWAALDGYINQDNYLSTRRGQYAERNGARTPASHIVDLRFLLDFKINSAKNVHRFQVSFDMFNFTNFLNKDWGRRYRSNFNGIKLYQFEGFTQDASGVKGLQPVYSVNPSFLQNNDGEYDSKAVLNIDDVGLLSSRWQGQVGIRYIFN